MESMLMDERKLVLVLEKTPSQAMAENFPARS